VTRDLLAIVAEEVTRSRSVRGGLVVRVEQPAGLQRQAPAADARRQVVAQAFELRDPFVEPAAPAA
jgi:hypothetical protein